jgi:hypothetical protein
MELVARHLGQESYGGFILFVLVRRVFIWPVDQHESLLFLFLESCKVLSSISPSILPRSSEKIACFGVKIVRIDAKWVFVQKSSEGSSFKIAKMGHGPIR